MSDASPTDDDDDVLPEWDDVPYWHCEECGHEDKTKRMPKDKKTFNARRSCPTCPRCRSESFVPVGW